jgi:hypothetical protein
LLQSGCKYVHHHNGHGQQMTTAVSHGKWPTRAKG